RKKQLPWWARVCQARAAELIAGGDTRGVKFPHGKHWNCCTTAVRRDLSAEVTGNTYEVQHAKHKCVNAIKFQSGDKTICAHPDEQWVKNLMARMTNKP
uniref:Chemokine interleukin-8-like domain-containing protein n=1 Tax=Oryzias latipes TaxID=8090 RepID=A0A3P9KVP6_ORYLA